MTGERRPVVGWEGVYEVSDRGIVFACERTIERKNGTLQRFPAWQLAGSRNDKGYIQVRLSAPGRRKIVPVHRLVALAFIPKPDGLSEVNHRDGVKTNNAVENLEWTTPRGNRKHAWATGLRRREHLPIKRGAEHPAAKLSEAIVEEARLAHAGGVAIRELARRFGVDAQTMRRAIRGRGWKHVLPSPPASEPEKPMNGEHEWIRNDPRWPSLRDMTFCVRCGMVQRKDGKNKPCSGKLAPIVLREPEKE